MVAADAGASRPGLWFVLVAPCVSAASQPSGYLLGWACKEVVRKLPQSTTCIRPNPAPSLVSVQRLDTSSDV